MYSTDLCMGHLVVNQAAVLQLDDICCIAFLGAMPQQCSLEVAIAKHGTCGTS